MEFLQKTSTEKITRDLQNFGSRSPPTSTSSSRPASSAAPSSAASSSPSQLQGTSTPSSGFSLASIFTPYTIGIVVVILLIFVAWFAWDYYKTYYKKTSTPTESSHPDTKQDEQKQQPIGGDTVKPRDLPPDSSTTLPPVVTTMSPMAYAKYQKDQQALQTALGTSHKGGGGEPLPDDSAAGAGKAGWCYIGEDQGYGVCANVQPEDKCLSGKVFPTETECRLGALPHESP
jgi:hypothetical protein